ncbi:hypothetical protein [Siminovitchia fortis]|uniref:hypothetical protein n=1 Tax=Siminovitchia fortis TaxID=254758 RepID=UPI00119FB9EE|nr:hypothetical protein [Siminovitchia fortis]
MNLVVIDFKDKNVVLRRNESSGVLTLNKPRDIKDIEKGLGIDQIKPITLTPSDSEDMNEKEQELRDWYEHELRKFFESQKREFP